MKPVFWHWHLNELKTLLDVFVIVSCGNIGIFWESHISYPQLPVLSPTGALHVLDSRRLSNVFDRQAMVQPVLWTLWCRQCHSQYVWMQCLPSFAPWCPACRQLQPVWGEFAEWGEDLGVNIAKVDVTEQPGRKFVLVTMHFNLHNLPVILCNINRSLYEFHWATRLLGPLLKLPDSTLHSSCLVSAGLSGRFIITSLPTIYQ